MMMMTASIPSIGGSAGNGGQTVSVPPGFRFHPTDEELLYYYLRKKVAYEVIDLDVIRDVDLNKLEPWDLKDKCRIGSGPQNEWYFFSHKDKKYPTGTRTNRATNAGFWKATGRDKAIHLSTMFHANVDAAASSYSNTDKRIGMRKTLVFYTGRAPHGQKTDWIMHEYRLDEENDHHHHHLHNSDHIQVQEDGWVVCRVFKKKNHQRGFQQQHLAADHHQVVEADHEHHHHHQAMQQYFNLVPHHMDDDDNDEPTTKRRLLFPQQPQYGDHEQHCFDGSMHLPQLLSPEKTSVACTAPPPPPPPPISFPEQDISEYCSSHHQSLMKLLTSNVVGGGGSHLIQQAVESGSSRNYKYAASLGAVGGSDWSFLDKLLAGSHQSLGQLCPTKCNPPSALMSMQVVDDDKVAADTVHEAKFPIFTHHHQYLGNYETDVLKFSNK